MHRSSSERGKRERRRREAGIGDRLFQLRVPAYYRDRMPQPASRCDMSFSSNIFPMEKITLGGTEEWIVRGGRPFFPPPAPRIAGAPPICRLGWGSPAPGQALNPVGN